MKVLFYALSLLLPILGLILYFVYRNKPAQSDRYGRPRVSHPGHCLDRLFLHVQHNLLPARIDDAWHGNITVQPDCARRPAPFPAWDRLSPIYQAHHQISTARFTMALGAAGKRTELVGRRGRISTSWKLGVAAVNAASPLPARVPLSPVSTLATYNLPFARQMAEQAQGDRAVCPGQCGRPCGLCRERIRPRVQRQHGSVRCRNGTHAWRSASRVLRPGGRLVFSLDHPLRDCFFDAETGGEDDEMSIIPARSYFD